MKRITKGIHIFLSVIIIFVVITAVYHRVALQDEADRIQPNGQMVDAGGYRVHVYIEGEKTDKPTLVFMAGSATVAPVYDFKVLYSKLSDHYHIAVVEKAGYGYSDINDTNRDIDSMVEEIRGALKAAGEESPYVLLPHSMSGLEAIRWAQKYPEEIVAIVGIDMANPHSYESFDESRITQMTTLGATLIKLGLHRIPGIYPLNTEALSNEEIAQQKLLMYRNAVNIDYIREGEAVLENADIVKNGGVVACPILLFVSNGKAIGDFWIPSQEQFADETDAMLILFDCGHYMHYEKSQEVSESIKAFLNSITE